VAVMVMDFCCGLGFLSLLLGVMRMVPSEKVTETFWCWDWVQACWWLAAASSLRCLHTYEIRDDNWIDGWIDGWMIEWDKISQSGRRTEQREREEYMIGSWLALVPHIRKGKGGKEGWMMLMSLLWYWCDYLFTYGGVGVLGTVNTSANT
jgi:hypothetical protein